ncbi:glycosyl hydrolase [bacterium]|nr:glycosyl hydrolase [bacterium]
MKRRTPSLAGMALLCLFVLQSPLQAQKSEKKARSKTEKTPEPAALKGMELRSIGPALTSGRISDIAVDPVHSNCYYVAAASGGVWKTDNNAATWTPIFDGQTSFSIGCVALDPHDPHSVWVGTGENNNQRSVAYGDGVYRSKDGGKSWNNVGLGQSEHIGQISFHPRRSGEVWVAAYGPLWKAGGERGLYRSTDDGLTWERKHFVDDHTGFNEVHFHPERPEWMYATAHQRRRAVHTYMGAGPGSGLYRSKDGGSTWEKVGGGLPSGDLGRLSLAISPARPDRMYLLVEGKGTYRTDDAGASWTQASNHYTAGNYYAELVPDPVNPDVVYSMDTYAQVSRDGGKSFETLGEENKHVDNHALWIDPSNPEHLRMGCDGGLYTSYDGGKNWHFAANLPITQFYRISTDNALPFYNVYGGTQDNFSLKGPSQTLSQHGALNSDWTVTNTGDGFETRVDPLDEHIVYAQSQYGGLVRFDARTGEQLNIKPLEAEGEPANRWNWDAPLVLSPHNPKRLYFAAQRVYMSPDQGQSWKVLSGDLSRNLDRNQIETMGFWPARTVARHQSTSFYGNITALDESPLAEGLLYAGSDDGRLHRLDPGTNDWKELALPTGLPERAYVQGLWCSKTQTDRVYLAINLHKTGDFTPHLYKSDNRGARWQLINTGLPSRGSVYSFAEDPVQSDLVFCGTEFGLFASWNGGQSWKKLEEGLPPIAVKDLEIQAREADLVVGTFGRGIYLLDDYTPLREMAEAEGKDHVFAIAPALVYEPSLPMGYPGGGFQGASLFRSENPVPGVVVTVQLIEIPKTLKAEREAREDENRKAGKPIPDPTAEDLREEATEWAPDVLLVFADERGVEVGRKVYKAREGLQRLHWEARFQKPGSLIREEGIPAYREGGLLPQGNYKVSVFLRHREGDRLIGIRPFQIEHLPQGSFAPEPASLSAFRLAVYAQGKALRSAQKKLNLCQSEIERMRTAVSVIQAAEPELKTLLVSLHEKLDQIEAQLNGEGRLAELQQPIPPGLTDVYYAAVDGLDRQYSPPTETQVRALERFERQLPRLVNELGRWQAELKPLYDRLVELGMDPTPSLFSN